MRLVSAVCYHAARPGHTIDPKRVVDATVPMADVMVCWTCQAFTDIARGERGGRKGDEWPLGLEGLVAPARPGPKPEPHHLRNGTSMFLGGVLFT